MNVRKVSRSPRTLAMRSFVGGGLVVALLGGCVTEYAPPSTEPLDTSVTADQPRIRMQAQADVAMAALGDAYRQAISDGEVTDGVLLLLADGFAGTARDAEEANLRDAIQSRNALARVPGDPLLIVDIVTDESPVCMIGEAEFDDRPLLAFPTALEGVDVVVRLVRTGDEDPWHIDELLTPQQADDDPIRCPTAGELSVLVPASTVAAGRSTSSPTPTVR